MLFFSSRRRHTRCSRDWSSDVCSSDLTDPYNRLVTGLDPDNFRVYEDNVEQEIVTFSAEDVPISIGVVFDFSGSMSNKVGKAREAALQFFKRSEEHTSELQSRLHLVCRLLLEEKRARMSSHRIAVLTRACLIRLLHS